VTFNHGNTDSIEQNCHSGESPAPSIRLELAEKWIPAATEMTGNLDMTCVVNLLASRQQA
jgi:hypothetical protein